MAFATETNRALETLLKKHETSYMSYAITPAERERFAQQGLLSRPPAQATAKRPTIKRPRPPKYTLEMMLPILDRYDQLREDGMSRDNACKVVGVSSTLIYQWKARLSKTVQQKEHNEET